MTMFKIIFSLFKEMILCFKPNLKKMFVIICGIIILSWFMVVCMGWYVFLIHKNYSGSVLFLGTIFSIVFFIVGLVSITVGIEKTQDKFKIFDN